MSNGIAQTIPGEPELPAVAHLYRYLNAGGLVSSGPQPGGLVVGLQHSF